MGEYKEDDHLSEVLKAVSDVTRRSLLTTLVQEGATRVTDLADRYDMSLNAISKHIKVLEKAGLVTRRTHGRVHLIEAELEHIRLVDKWFDKLRSIWDMRLDRLSEALQKRNDDNEQT